ncbi:rolling circle replication-associated protein [Zhongshania sp. BJYM1]|uniref:rolling circle replication-associated protein n=1 Tax=Zhongshania aquatica TaxID=2965069 RepID=UPI0022B39BB9|nr:hypothetical protein [Marortus sp. BJYM1]
MDKNPAFFNSAGYSSSHIRNAHLLYSNPQKPTKINENFIFADGVSLADVKRDQHWCKALSEAERNRLVKATKCPTRQFQKNIQHSEPVFSDSLESAPRRDVHYGGFKRSHTPEGERAAYAVFQFREWSNEYRIRSRVETTVGSVPPDNYGPRITSLLSDRGVRKICDSACYVAKKHGGFRTFFTLTFSPEARYAMALGETSIQKEVSRFMDGLQKMWSRGWKAQFVVNGRRIACVRQNGSVLGESGSDQQLRYLWVAECPDGKDGTPNPHVHVLINWRVKYSLFPSWAKRIESLWGQGMAHIEKLRDSDAAAAYMMKAAGYLCKAQGKSDQGSIRGNRYGISAGARAPDWETIEESQLHIMGALIADVADHLTHKYGDLYNKRKALKNSLETVDAVTMRDLRRYVGKQLEKTRDLINEIPVVATRYQIIFKNKDSFYEFMNWARSPGHWHADVCDFLPEKPSGEAYRAGDRPDSQFYAEFKKQHYWRRALRNQPKHLSDREYQQTHSYFDSETGSRVDYYSMYAQLAAVKRGDNHATEINYFGYSS